MTFQPEPGIVLRQKAIQAIPDLDAPLVRDVLTQAEYEAFRDALPTWRDRLIAMILRITGLRINEVLSLMVKECALDGPTSIIYVKRSKTRRGAEYEPIYINPGLGVQLRDYIKGQQTVLTDLVFGNAGTGRGSQKIKARGLRFVFAKAGIASIGRAVLPKEFRSFFVQTMVDGGVPMAMASKMMGHKDIRTTQGHYYDLSADWRRVIGEGIPV